MSDVVKNFLYPLERQFTLPKGMGDDPDGWANDYIEALGGYTDSLLGLAAKNIIKTREVRSFPLVAECVKACRDALDAMSEPDLKKPVKDRHDEWSDERRKMADKLFKCEMGRDAVAEGWSWRLWDFLRENGRHPDRFEVEKIREKGMANTRRFWEMVNSPPKPMNPHFTVNPKSFIDMHRNVTERLKKLVQTA